MSSTNRSLRQRIVSFFTGLTGLLTGAAALLGAIAGILTVVGVLGGSSHPGPEPKYDLRYLKLERNIRYGIHLTADRLDAHGLSRRQLGRLGNVVEVSVLLGGFSSKQLSLVWSLYRVVGTNEQPLPDPRFLNQPAEPIQLSGGGFVGSLSVWVPIPPMAGWYVARILILDKTKAVKYVDSDPFDGHATSTTPAAVPEPLVGTHCGVERWTVKTLQDRPTLLPAQATTIRKLISLRNPGAVGEHRVAPVELSTYRIVARLVEFTLEDDSDLKLIVADRASGELLTVELPADGCTQGAATSDRAKMSAARAALLRCAFPAGFSQQRTDTLTFTPLTGTASITGVGFFDAYHHQRAAAPNGIELHPALEFEGINCKAQ